MCANRISTFLRSRRDCWKASVLAGSTPGSAMTTPSPDLGATGGNEIPRPLIAYLGPGESAGWPLVLCPLVQLGCSSTCGQLQTL
jgi:hypothetical protein